MTQSNSQGLRDGCYLLRFTPIEDDGLANYIYHYDGTFRIDYKDSTESFSGDLYLHALNASTDPDGWPDRWPVNEPLISSVNRPIFPRAYYTYYMRGLRIERPSTSDNQATLHYELYQYSKDDSAPFRNTGTFRCDLVRGIAPKRYPTKNDFWVGTVLDGHNEVKGHLAIGWISDHLRNLGIELYKVSNVGFPVNPTGPGLREIFSTVGFDVAVNEVNSEITEPEGGVWTLAELHSAMLRHRDSTNMGADLEWKCAILCVSSFDIPYAGVMFDVFDTDANSTPREGCAVAAHFRYPALPQWGKAAGKLAEEVPALYFRTAVHELGHILGKADHHQDGGLQVHFGASTEALAWYYYTQGIEFPSQIEWSFSLMDARRLRHLPDAIVRPGGERLGSTSRAPDVHFDRELEQRSTRIRAKNATLEASVTAVNSSIPFGAPVRLHLVLSNPTEEVLFGPADISFPSGVLSGTVTNPTGKKQNFRSFIVCTDSPGKSFQPGERVEQSVTLLCGDSGALFCRTGKYVTSVDLSFFCENRLISITCETSVEVREPEDLEQQKVAEKIFSSPDAFVSFVLAGDHLIEGNSVLKLAMENPILRPHYAMYEVRRLGRRFFDRRADIVKAAELLLGDVVLSPSEKIRVNELLTSWTELPEETSKRISTKLLNRE